MEERLTAHVFFRDGRVLRKNFSKVATALEWADVQHKTADAIVRDRYTSDGREHVMSGHFYGRVLAVRENSRWFVY